MAKKNNAPAKPKLPPEEALYQAREPVPQGRCADHGL